MRLEGRKALVTGAGSGIGQATAELFAAEGAHVLAVDLPSPGMEALFPGNDAVIPFAQDITHPDADVTLVSTCLERLGGLDIVVNNAGIGHNALAEEMPLEAWDQVMDVNLRSMFRIIQKAIPHLKASQAGRIVNVASVMADGTDYGLSAYCASKAGVAGLTRTLALELGKFGITANYVLPGAILTGMTRASFSNEDIAKIWAKKSPLRRLGAPIDVARGILFLASDEGGFVTGHGLNLDGGLTLRI